MSSPVQFQHEQSLVEIRPGRKINIEKYKPVSGTAPTATMFFIHGGTGIVYLFFIVF